MLVLVVVLVLIELTPLQSGTSRTATIQVGAGGRGVQPNNGPPTGVLMELHHILEHQSLHLVVDMVV